MGKKEDTPPLEDTLEEAMLNQALFLIQEVMESQRTKETLTEMTSLVSWVTLNQDVD